MNLRISRLPDGVVGQEYFGLDKVGFFTYNGSLGIQSAVVESDAQTVISRDANGVYYRRSTEQYNTPAFIRATINTADDWRQYRSRLVANRQRLPQQMITEPITSLATQCATMDEYYALCIALMRCGCFSTCVIKTGYCSL